MLDKLRDRIAVWNKWAAARPAVIDAGARIYRPPCAKGPYRFGRESVLRHANVNTNGNSAPEPFRAQLYVEEHDSVEDPHCNVCVRLDHMFAGRTGNEVIASYKFQVEKRQGDDVNEARIGAEKFITRWNEDPAFAAALMAKVMPSVQKAEWVLPPGRAAGPNPVQAPA